ncbi:MAG: M56 family metallopeptidase, partial [Verrucomicrobiales bacterium]|nr:M56 family metallopeptidase [Verrucomicrobiales bacterium]
MDTLWNGLDTTAAAVLRCSLQATLLIPAVVAVRWVTGKWSSAAARRFLWWIVVGRLLLPWSPSAPFSVFEVLDFGGWTTLRGAGQSASAAGTARLERPTPAALALEPTRSAEPDAEAVSVARASGPTSSPLPSWNVGRALAGVWALGFLTVLGLTALDGTRMRRWVRTRTIPAGAKTSALLDDCRRRTGVRFPIAVRVGTWVRSPAVWGLWRPTVLLPAELESSAGVERLRHVLLHESAHVARRDLAWGLVLRFVQALHWFNPVLPWLLRRMRVEREIATDAKVLEATGAAERSAYGETLLALLEGAAARPPVFTGTAVGTTDGPADMEARIRAIATFTPTCGAGGRLAIGMAVALAMVCWTDAIPSAAPEKGASTKPRLGPAGELLPGGEDLGPGWSNRVTSLVDRGSPALEYFDPGVFEPARKAIRSHVPEGGAFCDSSYYRGSNFVFDAWLRRHESTNAVEDAWRNLRNAPWV